MEVFTNGPGIQRYGGNFMDSTVEGKSDKKYRFREVFCPGTQHFPGSPKQLAFLSTVLRPGEVYSSKCVYKFGPQRLVE